MGLEHKKERPIHEVEQVQGKYFDYRENIGNIERKLLIAGNFRKYACNQKYVEEKLTSLQPG